MARQWWQFKNWPDGTSGTDPSRTGLDPNEVELWPENTIPNACTLFRCEWINQFIAWKYYLEHKKIDSSTWWLTAYTDRTQTSDGFKYYGLQSAAFWRWLGTLNVVNDFEPAHGWVSKNMTMKSIPTYHLQIDNNHYQNDPQGYGFVTNTSFDAKWVEEVDRYGDLVVKVSELPDVKSTPDWFMDGSGWGYLVEDGEQTDEWVYHYGSNMQLLEGYSLAPYLLEVRKLFEIAGAYDIASSAIPYVAIGGMKSRQHRTGPGYDDYGEYHEDDYWSESTKTGKYPSYPFPSYGWGDYWRNHTMAKHPYLHNGEYHFIDKYGVEQSGTSVLHELSGPTAGGYTILTGWSMVTFVTGLDIYYLSEPNYKYAVVSYGKHQDWAAGFNMPPQHGYCHISFELEKNIDLDNPPSHIVNFTGLGDGTTLFIETDDDVSVERQFTIVSYPYDILPDDYKSPGWPTVSDGHGGRTYFLSNDRHNTWLDTHTPS